MRGLQAPLIALAAAAFSGFAMAETPVPQDPLAAPPPAPVIVLSKVGDAQLADISGGESVAISDQTLTAVNTGNSIHADSVTNGAVSLNANAFSGFAGIGNFVINTGNNNNLQGSLSVNIVMAPGN